MMRYVPRSAVGGYEDASATASEVILDEGGPVFSGLLDANGEKLYRVPERVPIGFQIKPRLRVPANSRKVR
jgi:hypothetical protein